MNKSNRACLARPCMFRRPRPRRIVFNALSPEVIGVGLFFTPGVLALIYSAIKGKGNVKDGFSHLVTVLSQGYLQPDAGGKFLPEAEGDLSEFTGSYIGFLYQQYLSKGGLFRLSFGPKSFIIISDPIIAKYVLREAAMSFDKGILAEILEPIMGKGLIPADLETWKQRRRAIVPAFHQAYLDAMVNMFVTCTKRTVQKLESGSADGKPIRVNMEDEFLSLGLDIIGLGVFNYDFGSVTQESPVIQSVYRCLREAEHRSTFYVPYWNIPFSDMIFPRLRDFKANMAVLDKQLDELIRLAISTKQEDDIESLQARDYANVKDPSLLRFLVDMRGEDTTGMQLRDDLMTFLIAGHETTAAALTWAIFCLSQNPEAMAALQEEVDSVLGSSDTVTWDQIKKMPVLRNTVAESLRLYPQPPVLIRRPVEEVQLPPGATGIKEDIILQKGCDIFISTWNLHRSPQLWENANDFDPSRFTREFQNENMPGWGGYNPSLQTSSLYPNETSSNYAFLPFGGGSRKCVGDQFAMLEACVALAMLVQRFGFELDMALEDVGITTGATIHTVNGLYCKVLPRQSASGAPATATEQVAV